MSETKLDFATSGSAAVQADLDKMTKALARAREQVRMLNETSKKSSGESAAGWKSELNSLTGLVSGYVGAGAAVGVMSRAVQGLRDDFKSAADEHKKLLKQMGDGATLSGNIKNLPALEKFQREGPGTPAQNLGALQGVQKEAPLMKFESQRDLAGQIARLSETGMSPEQLQKMGGLAGQLTDILPSDKPADIADAALTISQRAGGDLEKLGGDKFQGAMKRMVGAGMSGEKSLGLGLAALDANLPATTLDRLSELTAASGADLKPSSMGGATQGERDKNKAMLALSKMSGLERIPAMQNDPALARAALGTADALKFAQLTPDMIQKGEMSIRERLQRDVMGDQLREFRGTGPGAELAAEQGVDKSEADALARLGPDSARADRARRFIRSNVKDKGIGSRLDAEIGIGMGTLRELGPNRGTAGDTMISDAENRGHISGEQAAAFRQLERTIAENNRMTAENNRMMGPAQKPRNADAHIE